MSEFRKHHLVTELLTQLRASSRIKPENLLDFLLSKSATQKVQSQVASHAAKIRVASACPHSEGFLALYDKLKGQQIRELDPLVYVLSRIVEDDGVRRLLQEHCVNPCTGPAQPSGDRLPPEIALRLPRSVGDALSSSSTDAPRKMTAEEVSVLRDQLASVAKSAPAQQVKKTRARQQKGVASSSSSSSLPSAPSWFSERAYLTEDFPENVLTGVGQHVGPMGKLPLSVQEMLLIKEILFAMQGVRGQYITLCETPSSGFVLGERRFAIDQSVDPSLTELARRLLPMVANRSVVWQYVEVGGAALNESGLVGQALCAALRRELKELSVFVAQLESSLRRKELTLQQMVYYSLPRMQALATLADLCTRAAEGKCHGARLLSQLHELTVNNVAELQQLCLLLTSAAAVPYLSMVEQWVYSGVVSDPYGEFMVQESEHVARDRLRESYNDSYWDARYTVRRDCVPVFLETVADKILNAGKYLNVVRQCGRDVRCPDAVTLRYDATSPRRSYVEPIEQAHAFASQSVLQLIVQECDLRGHLRSLHRYFLLSQGDFFVHFLDLAEGELRKEVTEIAEGRLEALLELSLRTTSAETDPYKDDLLVVLERDDLITQLSRILSVESEGRYAGPTSMAHDPVDIRLSGLEAFSFDYRVQWPLSLVISRKALTKYQLIFRHLFYVRYVERQLNDSWLSAKESKQLSFRKAAGSSTAWLAAAFALRQRMLNFVQHLRDYLCVEVIEQNWSRLETSLQNVRTIDHVLNEHNDFLDRCLKDCMLTAPRLLKLVHKLLTTCVMFTNYLHKFLRGLNLAGLAAHVQAEPRNARQAATQAVSSTGDGSGNVDAMLETVSSNFLKHILLLLAELRKVSTDELERCMSSMVARLDYNDYYTNHEKRWAVH